MIKKKVTISATVSHRQAQMRFKCKEITDIILKSFYEVYDEPGDGFLESVHENALLLNFGRKPEFKRFVYDNKRKISVMISVDRWLNSYEKTVFS